ncbi:MAG: sulfite exporter TauE/SafE family protein [Pirellulales bacterium]
MSNDSLLLAVTALALAGFVQGLTGFGFGMTAMSLLPLVVSLVDAQAIVTLTSTAACLLMAAVTLRDVPWSELPRLWLGVVAGVPLGFGVLESLPPVTVTRALGLMLCLMVLFEFLVAHRRSIQWPPWLEPVVGIVSGALTGAFNIGGPPLVACIYSRPWTKEKRVAGLTAVFLSGGLVRVALLLKYHELPREAWSATAWSLAPMLLAILCGNRLLRRVPERPLRAAVFGVLLFLGVRYLLA